MALPLENFRSPLALFRFYGICAMGLLLDLVTKYVAEDALSGGTGYEFIPGWLHFTWVENTGAVFGIGAGRRWLFVGVSVLALGFLTWLFAVSGGGGRGGGGANEEKGGTGGGGWGYQIILGMLLAGVLGNMYDRVKYGHVRDMIYGLPGWRWPEGLPFGMGGKEVFPYVFNVADVMLCCGVGLMLVHAVVTDFLVKERSAPVASGAVVSNASGSEPPV